MPLPEKFYNLEGNEVSLETLCRKEPEWAANRISELTELVDKLEAMLDKNDNKPQHELPGRISGSILPALDKVLDYELGEERKL